MKEREREKKTVQIKWLASLWYQQQFSEKAEHLAPVQFTINAMKEIFDGVISERNREMLTFVYAY